MNHFNGGNDAKRKYLKRKQKVKIMMGWDSSMYEQL